MTSQNPAKFEVSSGETFDRYSSTAKVQTQRSTCSTTNCLRLATKQVWDSTQSHMYLYASKATPITLRNIITRRARGIRKRCEKERKNRRIVKRFPIDWVCEDDIIYPQDCGAFVLLTWDNVFSYQMSSHPLSSSMSFHPIRRGKVQNTE